MDVTRHGMKKVRHRLGLPKKAVSREADRAWNEGTKPEDMPGALRHYCEVKGDDHEAVARIYGEHLFFFSESGLLITAYPVPPKYRHALARLRGENPHHHNESE